jgi:hypothetical protein
MNALTGDTGAAAREFGAPNNTPTIHMKVQIKQVNYVERW